MGALPHRHALEPARRDIVLVAPPHAVHVAEALFGALINRRLHERRPAAVAPLDVEIRRHLEMGEGFEGGLRMCTTAAVHKRITN